MTDAAGSARSLLLKSIGLAHGSHEKVKHGWETDQGELDGARHHLLVLWASGINYDFFTAYNDGSTELKVLAAGSAGGSGNEGIDGLGSDIGGLVGFSCGVGEKFERIGVGLKWTGSIRSLLHWARVVVANVSHDVVTVDLANEMDL